MSIVHMNVEWEVIERSSRDSVENTEKAKWEDASVKMNISSEDKNKMTSS